jgi:hypothetical protein
VQKTDNLMERPMSEDLDLSLLDAPTELVAELATLVLEDVAPEEQTNFEETSKDYFADPRAMLSPQRREEAVGFGLDLALFTPYVLAVVTPVVGFLATTVAEGLREEARPVVLRLVRRLFRRSGDTGVNTEGGPCLDQQHAQRVRDIAHERAKALGLRDDQATLLADSVVGAIWVAG